MWQGLALQCVGAGSPAVWQGLALRGGRGGAPYVLEPKKATNGNVAHVVIMLSNINCDTESSDYFQWGDEL